MCTNMTNVQTSKGMFTHLLSQNFPSVSIMKTTNFINACPTTNWIKNMLRSTILTQGTSSRHSFKKKVRKSTNSFTCNSYETIIL